MSKRTTLWILLGIIIIGVLLRSYHLTTRSLWFDESFSWRLIQFPFDEMIARTAADVHPPFYYVGLRAWATVFGPSILSLRAFSVTAAALTIAAAYLFASSAFRSRLAGLLAAALIALSGWHIAFAWEARMYTLGTALALLSSWLLMRAVRRPNLATWIYYAVVATLFAYTHYFAFFTLAAHALTILGYLALKSRGRVMEMLHSRTLWLAGLAGVLVLLLYAPWLPVFLRQNQQVQASYWVPEPLRYSVADTFYRFVFPTIAEPPHAWPTLTLTLAPGVVTLAAFLFLLVRRRLVFESWLTVLAAALPVAAAWGTALLGQSLYQDRFLVFANVFVLVAAAAATTRLRPPRLAATVSLLLAATLLGSFVKYWQELDIPHRPGVRGAIAAITEARQENEPVIVGSSFIFFPADYYVRAAGGDPPKLLTDTVDLAHFAGAPIITPNDVVMRSTAFASPTSRLWLIDTTGFGGRETDVPATWTAVSRQTFPEVFPHQGDIIVREVERR